jgi:hypothetical protein
MGFKPSYVDPDIWMHDAGSSYEYVCSYVDDLMVILKEPEAFFANLKKRGLKRVTVDPEVFLGRSFS